MGITKKLLFAVFLVSSGITTVLTAVNFYLEYRMEMTGLDEQMDRVRRISIPAIGEAVWGFNHNQIHTLAMGMLHIRDITAVRISSEGKVLLRKEKPAEAPRAYTMPEVVPLTDAASGRTFGQVELTVTRYYIYQRLLRETVLFFATQGVKSFLVAFLLFYLFNRLVTRRILGLSGRVRRFPADPAASLPEGEGDEIAVLAGALEEYQSHVRRYNQHSEQTIREQNEALQQSVREKSQLVANLSHEIRTPLHAILGYSRILLDEDPRSDGPAQVIHDTGTMLLSMIGTMLEYSELEEGGPAPQPEPVNLGAALRSVAELFRLSMEEKGLRFLLDLDSIEGKTVLMDFNLVRPVIINLLGNALKYTEKGQVRLGAVVEPDRLLVAVKDTGPGIPAERQDEIFDRYSRAPAGSKDGVESNGLGLAISRKLAGRLDGDLVVDSRPGEGSVFTLTLPVRVLQEQAPSGGGPSGKLKVMVVDDNPVNRDLIPRLLSRLPVTTRCLESGEQCLQAWEEESWDLILLDFNMPGLDGVQTAKLLRQREREASRPGTPIVGLTANSLSEARARAEDCGMDRIETKPISRARLLEIIAWAGQDQAA